MFAMKKFITGWNEDPCFFTILIKIDLATLYVDSDLDKFEIKSIKKLSLDCCCIFLI